jgi:hypothetical protein
MTPECAASHHSKQVCIIAACTMSCRVVSGHALLAAAPTLLAPAAPGVAALAFAALVFVVLSLLGLVVAAQVEIESNA